MKKRLLLCFTLATFMVFSFVQCTQDILTVEDSSRVFENEARLYFEQNASDIQVIRIGNQEECLSRSMVLSSRVITPNWQEGESVKRGAISSLEVPLTGDVYVKSVYSRVQNGESLTSVSSVQMKLIIQKHDQLEEMRSFIVTIITDSRNEIMGVRSSQVSSYLNVKDFSGLMIVSDLEGNYLDAFQFTDGKNQRVALARTSGMKEECIDTKDITSTFLLLDAYHTGIYSRSGESGGIIDGGGIPEVVVRYCRMCNLPVDQCSGHQNPSVIPPPLEWYCPDCKSSYCPGNCQLGGNTGTTPGTDSGVERTPIADKLYHPDSKLTNKQKKKLNQALDEFVKKYPEFKEMYDKLVQNDRKIVFEIDPKPFEKSKGYAGYDALT